MRVRTIGAGDPEVAVVGAVHGDEPCGARAIDRILEDTSTLQRPTAFIVANEKALELGQRFIDVDLNRVLPGDPAAETHEGRLAARLVDAVNNCVTLGIHSTQSYDGTFGVLSAPNDRKCEIFGRMTLEKVIDTSLVSDGRCVDQPMFIDVEVGPQGTENAIRRAEGAILSFLRAVDALPGTNDTTETEYYEVTDIMEKDRDATYRFLADNFERVRAGEPYATKNWDRVIADESFWPVLTSANGHETILGYRAQRQSN